MSGDVMTAEAKALYAILDDAADEAERILRGFLPGELGALSADIRRDPMRGVVPKTLTAVASEAAR